MNASSASDISAALSQLDVAGADWARIRHSERRGFSVPASNTVVLHIVLSGMIEIQANGSDVPTKLFTGDSAILLGGARHSVRTSPGLPTKPLDYFHSFYGLDTAPFLDLASDGEEAGTTSMMGMLYLAHPPSPMAKDLVPAIISHTRNWSSDPHTTRATMMDETSRSSGGALCITKFAEMMMTKVYHDLLVEDSHLNMVHPGVNASKIARALRMIRVDLSRYWTVANLAEAVGMSRSAFAEKFLLETGQTPMAAVHYWRMREAAKMLEHPDVRVKEVAARVGYRSESSFTRRFTRMFGVAPGALRQQTAILNATENDNHSLAPTG